MKYKEIFNELSNGKIGEIYNISKEINFNNLTYHFAGSNIAPINCIRGSMCIYNELKNGNISTEKIEEDQKQFKSKLNEITLKNKKYNLYNSRDKVIKFYNDYAKIISEAMYKTKQGTALKILTPKQMLQRLLTAIPEVKAGNNS